MAGIYIHIPFCRSKCAYCDFYSGPLPQSHERYVRALIDEWQMRRQEIAGHNVQTVYIGGGTPSVLSPPLLRSLIKALPTTALTEFTLEANPEDVSSDWLAKVREMGINRVSIGVQSFSDEELCAIGRRHSASSALSALSLLRQSGINFSADLIYGLPGQTLTGWRQNLKRLFEFQPPHFSAYLLSYEPGTRLTARRDAGKIREASEETAQEFYQALCREAKLRGYEHYEISNFALPGFRARHNSAYWNLTPYLGLGCAAHSFDGSLRRYNPPSVTNYLKAIESGKTAFEIDEETAINRLNDYIITALRTSDGLTYKVIGDRWGNKLLNDFRWSALPLLESGMLKEESGRLIIPEPHWLLSDAIMRDLILS